MFIGHYALAFGAKKLTPLVSLGTLFMACQLADLLWPTFVMLGLEHFEVAPGDTAVTPLRFTHYPYSHSLVALVGWLLAFGLGHVLIKRSGWFTATVLGALVFSHYVLDVVTHRPDMPVTFGGEARLGLSLWNSKIATIAVEVTLFAIGVGLYTRATKPRDRAGSIGFIALIGFLVLTYFANLFGPPPPSVAAVAWSAQLLWLLVFWGYWLDRHRTVVTPA